jgi:hypothetical protein
MAIHWRLVHDLSLMRSFGAGLVVKEGRQCSMKLRNLISASSNACAT